MELDEMKLAWQQLDQRLDKQQAVNAKIFRDGRMNTLRRGLRPLVLGQLVQGAIGLLFALWAGAFWVTQLQVTHLLVCGLLVHAFGLLLVVLAVRVLYLVWRIDYAAPVTAIQRDVASLRAWRVRVEAPINATVGCFIWIPVLWMSLAEHGVDLWPQALAAWAVSSSVVGLLAVVVVVWVMRRLGMGRKLEDNAAGSSVRKAEAMLDEIIRFEHE